MSSANRSTRDKPSANRSTKDRPRRNSEPPASPELSAPARPSTGGKWIRLLAVAGLLVVSACTKKQDSVPELNLAIWPNYLSAESAARFTKETGIRLNITNYSSNEELLAKIQGGASGLDVAVPSDYMVGILIKLDLLEKIDKTKIPSVAGLSPTSLKQSFDPDNSYSLPYSWNLVGIAVNRELWKEPVTSWKDLLDNPGLAGKFALLDDVREVTAAVLLMQGKDVNTTDEKDLKAAKEFLLRIRKNVKMFISDSIDILVNKEVAAAQAYMTDALQASVKTGGKIEFIFPKEGATRSIDNLVVLKSARHKEAAAKLIDFLLRKENNIELVKAVRAGPVVVLKPSELPEDLRGDTAIFPTAEMLSRTQKLFDLGAKNRLYEDIWTAVKTGY